MKTEILKRADRGLAAILKWSSVASLVGLLILIAAGVFVRFVPVASMGWADEIIEFGFIWMVFFGSAVLWRERTHFRVDFIPLWLAGKTAGRVLELFLNFLSLVFLAVLSGEGWQLAMRATDESPILAWPKTLWYIVVPISGAIMLGYTIRDIWLLLRGRPLT